MSANPYELIYWAPGMTLDELERRVVQKAIVHFDGNKSATAKTLGITVKTLENKLSRYKAEEEEHAERQQQQERHQEELLKRARGPVQRLDGSFDCAPIIQESRPGKRNGREAIRGDGEKPATEPSRKPPVSVSQRA